MHNILLFPPNLAYRFVDSLTITDHCSSTPAHIIYFIAFIASNNKQNTTKTPNEAQITLKNMITENIFATPRSVDATSSKSSTINKRRNCKNRIEARLLTRFGRKVITQRLLMKTLAAQDPKQGPSPSPSLMSAAISTTSSPELPAPTAPAGSNNEPIRYPVEYMRQPKVNAKVKFQETVSVKEIPSRRSYEEDERKNMWSAQKEIVLNAIRNKREWVADGRSLELCKEEDEMFLLEGKLLHPETYLWLQRHRQKRVVRKLRVAKKMEDLAKKSNGSNPGCQTAMVARRVMGTIRLCSGDAPARYKGPTAAKIMSPLHESSNHAADTKDVASSLLAFPSLPGPASPIQGTDSSPRNKRSFQDDVGGPEGRNKVVPFRKAPKSIKFVVHRRATLFRLPTRTAREEMATASNDIVCPN
jgi:hypothetical protein